MMPTIRELREAVGMTQIELAERLGVSHAAVSYWERGRNAMNVRHLKQLASIFGVSMDEIDLLPEERKQPRGRPRKERGE
jgi:transcriptional regulator with XRE-family HTH domain